MTDYVHTSELSFDQWLEIKLKELKLSGSALARGIERDRSTVSQWRTASKTPKAPGKEALAKFFEALGVDNYNALIREIIYHVHVSEMRRIRS
tara:strand:+ start:11182 stop:11460 length:279 start_codon:yes stop_codon:yes gene_type:complete